MVYNTIYLCYAELKAKPRQDPVEKGGKVEKVLRDHVGATRSGSFRHCMPIKTTRNNDLSLETP
jgi:hypothetical protein